MEPTERINILIETIKGLDQVTVNRWEADHNKIIPVEDAEEYETWETTQLKETLFTQLGKLYFKENSTIE